MVVEKKIFAVKIKIRVAHTYKRVRLVVAVDYAIRLSVVDPFVSLWRAV